MAVLPKPLENTAGRFDGALEDMARKLRPKAAALESHSASEFYTVFNTVRQRLRGGRRGKKLKQRAISKLRRRHIPPATMSRSLAVCTIRSCQVYS